MIMVASQSQTQRSQELGVLLLSVPSEKSAQSLPSPWPLVTLGEKRSIAHAWRKAHGRFCLPGLWSHLEKSVQSMVLGEKRSVASISLVSTRALGENCSVTPPPWPPAALQAHPACAWFKVTPS